MPKIPSYPFCQSYENAYVFMKLGKRKFAKTPKCKFLESKQSKNPNSWAWHYHQSAIGLLTSPRYTNGQRAWRPTSWVVWKRPLPYHVNHLYYCHCQSRLRLHQHQQQHRLGYGLRLGTGLVYCMACTGLVSIMSRVGGPCAFRLISVAILAQACSCFAPDS